MNVDIEKEHIQQAIGEFNAFSAGEKPIEFQELYEKALLFLEAYEQLEKQTQEKFTPRSMDTAPTDGTVIWILTNDFGWVEGFWDSESEDYYKSNMVSPGYDPENSKGTWVGTTVSHSGGDRRLYLSFHPKAWMPKLPTPKGEFDE